MNVCKIHFFSFQFLFIEGADIPDLGSKPLKIKESLRTVTPQGRLTTTTKTTFQQNGKYIKICEHSSTRDLDSAKQLSH